MDPRSETFVDAHTFCWNCAALEEGQDWIRYKCYGHSIGGVEHGSIKYADDCLGRVREHSESVFIALKDMIHSERDKHKPSSTMASFGFCPNTTGSDPCSV